MTKEEKEKLYNYIEKNFGTEFECPMCKHTDWVLTGSIYQMPAFNKRGASEKDRDYSVFPVVPMICEKCGYVIFLNAISCGLIGDQ